MGKGLCWLLGTSVRKIYSFLRTDVPRSQHNTINLAEAVGTATGSIRTKGGERRQAGRIVEFVQALHPHYWQRRIGFQASRATYVPHVLRSKPSSSRLSTRTSNGLSGGETGQ